MRLLRLQNGELSITKFDKNFPPYAILSHTWGAEQDEVNFEDASRDEGKSKKGYEKIQFCAKQVVSHSLEYFWIDTCCINKADSQEFQSAINSMFRWYHRAEVCFAYMDDVTLARPHQTCPQSVWKEQFIQSRWFRRSWTLQELLAPRLLKFYSHEHHLLGTKTSLEQELHAITKIPIPALRGIQSLPFDVDECILWAKGRESTIEEDQAYSLIGLCGVLMNPMYGIGAKEAFTRLRQKYNKQVNTRRGAYLSRATEENDLNQAGQSLEVPALVHIDEAHPSALTRTSNLQETRMEPLNKAMRRVVDLFGVSIAALKIFQDLAGDSFYHSIDSEISKLQKCHATLLQTDSPSKIRNDPDTYFYVESLLETIGEVCRDMGPNLLESRPENYRLFEAQGRSNWATQPDSKSSRFRQNIDHEARLELITKFTHVLCFLLVPGGAETHRLRYGGIASRDDAEYLKNTSEPQKFWTSELQKIRTRKTEETEASIRKQVDSWLLHNYVSNEVYDRFAPERLEGTCEWILERETFRSWCSDNFPANTAKIMWIYGPAGYGKTVLCTRIIKHLCSKIQAPVAHFFFSTDSEREDPYVAIRSWTSQTMAHSRALDLAHDAREADYVLGATRLKVIELFQSIIRAIPGCTFILDGLDECCWEDKVRHRRNSVIEFLDNLKLIVANTNTRIMIVSRNEPEIRRGLDIENQELYDYGISIEDVRSDTEKYSRSIIEKNLSKKTEETKQELSARLANRCEGQFLWLRMQENSLDGLMTQTQLRKTIDTTPAQLDQVYDPNWKKIMSLPSIRLNRAVTILRWAAFAFRPLTVQEIVEAQAITDDCEDLPVDDIEEILNEDDIENQILKDCGSLLEVRKNPSKPVEFHTVHLTHFTVKQFLVSRLPLLSTLSHNPRLPGHVDEKEHSVLIGKLCLQYINFPTVWKQPVQVDQYKSGESLRDYAAGSWYKHVAAEMSIDRNVTDLINVFFNINNANWISWRTWFDSSVTEYTPRRESGTEESSPLYYASLLELVATVEYLLQEIGQDKDQSSKGAALRAACECGNLEIMQLLLVAGAPTSEVDVTGRSAVNIASAKGHVKVIKTLLNNGADVCIADDDGTTPLHNASQKGHLEVVELLLNQEADVSAVTEDKVTALHFASSSGQSEVVKLLLDKGANACIADDDGWTPLHIASQKGYLEVVKLLFDKGANTCVTDNDGSTPLHAASQNGHLDVVELLLNQEADVSAVTEDKVTALHFASSSGQSGVVKLLLDKGANACIADNDGWTPLHIASQKGYLEVVKLLLENGADTSAVVDSKWTPLHAASRNGHLEVVKLLLDKGADTSAITKDGRTPLHIASYNRHLEVMKLLLDQKADVSAVTEDKTTSLHFASSNGHLEIVKLLLGKGANSCMADNNGWTPLHIASQKGYLEMVKLLLENGADTSAVVDSKWTPLHAASRNGHLEVVRLLLEKNKDLIFFDKDGWTTLNSASSNGHIEVVKLLLEKGADITIANKEGWTPLHAASRNGHLEVVKLLLQKNKDLGIFDNDGWTPLNSASSNGHIEVVKLLLEKGADLTIANESGWTPLNSASNNGHIEVVRLLLEKGANLTIANKDGWTPLNSASDNGYFEIIKLLLEKDADIESANKEGWTPLNSASSNGHLGAVKLLLEKGADLTIANKEVWTPLNSASSYGHIEVVKLLLEKGADLTIASEGGWTPLNSASSNGHIEVVKLLLEKGADLTMANEGGWTPLNSASDNGHIEVVKLLLEKGADLTIANTEGWTPLNSASDNGYIEIIKLLLEKGADLTIANKSGWTPLNSVSSNGHLGAVKLLLEKGADLTIADKGGSTPLNSASSYGHIEVVKLLLEKGADLTIANNEGWTPLNSASSYGHIEVVKLLLEKGADLTIASEGGWTPLNSASSYGHIEVVRLLLEKGADLRIANKGRSTPLNSASNSGHIEVVKLLLEKGADLTIANNEGWTPLNSASDNGHIEVVKLLLEKDAAFSISSNEGWTPINSASDGGHIEVVKLLLEKGADLSIANKHGWTPLHNASRNGHLEVVQLLLEKGADLLMANKNGWTPLSISSHRGHTRVVEALIMTASCNINACDVSGISALALAVKKGHLDIVDLLIEKGAEVRLSNLHGSNCINLAANEGHLEVVKKLLDHGCEWNMPNISGSDALQLAIIGGHSQIEAHLLSIGAVMSEDVYGFRTLFRE